ncbi:hypothetical protein RND71_009765 [Anisodus tanguticus]|uniref:Uncharacterized protein n=1 Tax=Anisodus tanguticus TaxID=243964 RepID=A0AAE1SHX5_9SOLA|nr:hypothetical protein RND71_009765 [Anisodus tanguticus]
MSENSQLITIRKDTRTCRMIADSRTRYRSPECTHGKYDPERRPHYLRVEARSENGLTGGYDNGYGNTMKMGTTTMKHVEITPPIMVEPRVVIIIDYGSSHREIIQEP